MYHVTTLEKWKSHVTATIYYFSNISERNIFIEMCVEDGIYIIVHKNQIAV